MCSPSPGEGSSLVAYQAGSQVSQASQAGAHLPPGEGSSLAASQAGRQSGLPGRHSPSPKGRKQHSGNSGHSGRQPPRQLLTFPLGKEAT